MSDLMRIISQLERFNTVNKEDIPYLVKVLKSLLPAEEKDKTKLYNHAFEIAFSINSDYEGDNVPEEELIQGLEERLKEMKSTPGLILEACGAAYDTYDNDVDNSLKFMKE